MQYKEGILRFTFGDYPAIGIKHFEERRTERIKAKGTDIFDEIDLPDEEVLLRCFKILEKEKYREIIQKVTENKPRHTEFIVGFETDEQCADGNFKYVFLVFSISSKETAMNGIRQGEEFLSCITVVKDTYKKQRVPGENVIEETFSYCRDQDGGDFFWKKGIKRK